MSRRRNVLLCTTYILYFKKNFCAASHGVIKNGKWPVGEVPGRNVQLPHWIIITSGSKRGTHKHKINSIKFIQLYLLTPLYLVHLYKKRPDHIQPIAYWTYSFNTFLSYWTHWSSKMYKLSSTSLYQTHTNRMYFIWSSTTSILFFYWH